MAIRRPAANLSPPHITVLPAGTVLHRIHDRTFAANAFNPCRGGPTRFAPIFDPAGACVPSLYAGGTFEAAAYETIFHDVPAAAPLKTVPMGAVTSRAHGELRVARNLKLATLRTVDLKKWHVTRTSLIASPPTRYAETAAWAQAIHDQFGDVAGLVWTSNQCDPDDAYLFYGDRVAAADLTVAATRDGMTDTGFLADLRAAGLRGGIAITL